MTVTVREVHSEGDCLAVVDLTATNFPHEQQATKISLHKWREIQLDDWVRQPWLWSHVGGLVLKVRKYRVVNVFCHSHGGLS